MPDSEVCRANASDGYEFAYRRLVPKESSRGEVIILHGIQSHGGWYLDTAQWLRERGWTVSLPDRRGSGLNPDNRGDCPSFRRLLDDVADFVQVVRQANKPVIILAISWGGKLALALPKRHPGVCDGLVLVAPGVCRLSRPGILTRLHVLASRLIWPTRLFPIPLNDPALFTDNPDRRRYIADDALSLRLATARLLVENARLSVYLRSARRRVTVPTLVMLAGRDRIIDNRRTRRFLRKVPGPVSVTEFAASAHTLEFEQSGPPYFGRLGQWLDLWFPVTSP